MISGYKIQHEIGNGQFAKVYLAKHIETNQDVALKLIDENFSRNPIFREKYLQLCGALPQIEHPNSINIFDAGVVDEQCFIAVEHIEGKSLHNRLRIGYPADYCLEIIGKISEVIDLYHFNNNIHGGIRSHNIFMDDEGEVVLAEPELALMTCQEIGLQIADTTATCVYSNPKKITDLGSDKASDYYDLGTLLYELLEKKPPFQNDNLEKIKQSHLAKIPALSSRINYIQPLLNKLYVKAASKRLSTAKQVFQAITEVKSQPKKVLKSSKSAMPPPPISTKAEKKSIPIIPIMILALLIVAGVSYRFMNQEDSPEYNQAAQDISVEDNPVSIEQLLTEAKALQKKQYFTAPKGKNAYEKYHQILALDPQNEQAKRGMKAIVRYFNQEAIRHKLNDDLYDSIDTIEQGLLKFPGNSILLRLQKEVEEMLNEVDEYDYGNSVLATPVNTSTIDTSKTVSKTTSRVVKNPVQVLVSPTESKMTISNEGITNPLQKEVDQLIDKAKKQIRNNRLTSPKGDNAYETYQAILNIAPNQRKKANQIIKRISTRYFQLANTHYQAGLFNKSLTHIKSGLNIVSSDKRLNSLQNKVLNAIKARRLEKQATPKSTQSRVTNSLVDNTKPSTPSNDAIENTTPNALNTRSKVDKTSPLDQPVEEDKKQPKIRVFGTF